MVRYHGDVPSRCVHVRTDTGREQGTWEGRHCVVNRENQQKRKRAGKSRMNRGQTNDQEQKGRGSRGNGEKTALVHQEERGRGYLDGGGGWPCITVSPSGDERVLRERGSVDNEGAENPNDSNVNAAVMQVGGGRGEGGSSGTVGREVEAMRRRKKGRERGREKDQWECLYWLGLGRASHSFKKKGARCLRPIRPPIISLSVLSSPSSSLNPLLPCHHLSPHPLPRLFPQSLSRGKRHHSRSCHCAFVHDKQDARRRCESERGGNGCKRRQTQKNVVRMRLRQKSISIFPTDHTRRKWEAGTWKKKMSSPQPLTSRCTPLAPLLPPALS